MSSVLSEDLARVHEQFAGSAGALRGKSILVTGFAGFLGYGLTQYLVRYAQELGLSRIIGVDNFKLRKPPAIAAAAFHLVNADIAQGLPKQAEGADFVIHLASIASPTFYRRYPLETIDANVWGLRAVLEHCRGSDAKLLFFSSSEIYGDPDPQSIPTPEDYRGLVPSIGPRACYDEAKRFGETLCYVFATQYGVPITIVRPFNNYGPGMVLDDQRAPADFARAVLENRDILIHSDGTPTRTYCYVADAIVGYLRAFLQSETLSVYNIGSDGPEMSVREFAELFAKVGRDEFGYTGQVRLQASDEPDYLTDNPQRRCPDITRARAELGFAPVTTPADGIARYLRSLSEPGATT